LRAEAQPFLKKVGYVLTAWFVAHCTIASLIGRTFGNKWGFLYFLLPFSSLFASGLWHKFKNDRPAN
jgi:hypothetical protein